MATVHHPDAEFNGTATIGRRTLTFTEGVADMEGPPAAWRRAGYEVAAGGPAEVVVELEDMTVAKLRDLAAERDVKVPAKARKGDVVKALVESVDDDDQDS